jgi:hypothetical protein
MPTIAQELQDRYVFAVRKSQEITVDVIRTWVAAIQRVSPKVPAVKVPLADKLPKPQDVVARSYDFAEQLLASQRKFADEVLKATAPLLPGSGQRDEKSAA